MVKLKTQRTSDRPKLIACENEQSRFNSNNLEKNRLKTKEKNRLKKERKEWTFRDL